MKNIIRLGDKHTGGGSVLSASMKMMFHGVGAARVGDPVDCPKHGKNVLAEGHITYKDYGRPVAFHGHRCACGCTLISSLPSVTAM